MFFALSRRPLDRHQALLRSIPARVLQTKIQPRGILSYASRFVAPLLESVSFSTAEQGSKQSGQKRNQAFFRGVVSFLSSFRTMASSKSSDKVDTSARISDDNGDRSSVEWGAPTTLKDLLERLDIASGTFSALNKADSGAQTEAPLPVGPSAPFQLYSLSTPNGQKVGILLEELGVDYDAHTINIMEGDQFTSGFVAINPNSKIPALVHYPDRKGAKSDGTNGGAASEGSSSSSEKSADNTKSDSAQTNEREHTIPVFESAAIMLYLAETVPGHDFLPPPTKPVERAALFSWLSWQIGGQGPFFGQFGHYFRYAPRNLTEAIDYGVYRYGTETKRLLDVLDKQLHRQEQAAEGQGHEDVFVLGAGRYSLADMAIYPWVECLVEYYKADRLLGLEDYRAINRWRERMRARPAVQRGMTVTSFAGPAKPWLRKDGGEGESAGPK